MESALKSVELMLAPGGGSAPSRYLGETKAEEDAQEQRNSGHGRFRGLPNFGMDVFSQGDGIWN